MDTYTLLIFHLPVFIHTFLFYLFVINLKQKKYHSLLVTRSLKIAQFIILILLLLELIYWFIMPAYNYSS